MVMFRIINFFLLPQLSENNNTRLSKIMTFIEKLKGMGVDDPIDAEADVKFEDFIPLKMDHKYFYYNVRLREGHCFLF